MVTIIKIYCKDPRLKVEFKKIAAEFGTYEKALERFIEIYKRHPEIFKRKFA